MKLIAPILYFALRQVDASQLNLTLRKDRAQRERRLISFSAFNELIAEGGAETASDASSPTLAPALTSSASKTEVRTTLAPTISPTKMPSQFLTTSPTDKPTDQPTTDAPTTSSPTDRPTTEAAITSSSSTSASTTSEPTESPSIAPSMSSPTTLEPTNNPTAVAETTHPTTAATPTDTPTATPSSFAHDGVSSTRTSSLYFKVKGEAASNQATLDSICSATQRYVNTVTKRSFGKRTVTTMDCSASMMGQIHATTITEFHENAPDAVTYDDYIQVVMISDETVSTLPSKIAMATSSLGMDQEVKAAVDYSAHPAVLQLSFEELHDSAVSMRPTCTAGAIMVAFFTVFVAA
ncbi:MAG: hypothetical protein SGBAC_009176 [Bacillariaceae sp.]